MFLWLSFAAAISSFVWPHWGVPADYDAILWRSIPLACIWAGLPLDVSSALRKKRPLGYWRRTFRTLLARRINHRWYPALLLAATLSLIGLASR
jgi:hypothetical protein